MTALELLRSRQQNKVQVPAPVAPAPAPIIVAPPIVAPAPAPVAAPSLADKAVQAAVAATLTHQPEAIEAKAILVSFSASMPRNLKVDRKVTKEVQAEKNMGAQSGKWDKVLFKPDIYKACASVISAARSWHYAQTLDWPINGAQLLPTRNHEAYCTGMREWQKAVEKARDEFLARLPEIIAWARREHNGSFDESLYDEKKLRRKFDWQITFLPIPASNHFVASIRDALGASAAQVDSVVTDAVKDAQRALWVRLLEPLQNMKQILLKKEDGEGTRITQSLLGNLIEIAKLVPALDLSSDPALGNFAAEVEQAFKGFSSEQLSEDKSARQQALERAQEIMRRMNGVMGGETK